MKSLTWGDIFTPLVDQILWVLGSTIANDEVRTLRAKELSQATVFLSDAYIHLCVADSSELVSQVPRFIDFGPSTQLLMIPSRRFSDDEVAQFKDEIGANPWPCETMPQPHALELLELAALRIYTGFERSDQLLCLESPVGSFYIFPRERKRQVERALALNV